MENPIPMENLIIMDNHILMENLILIEIPLFNDIKKIILTISVEYTQV